MGFYNYIVASKLRALLPLLSYLTLSTSNLAVAQVGITESSPRDSSKLIERVVVTTHKAPADFGNKAANISIISHKSIEQAHNSSLLPTLVEQVPGLFVTSRSVMGYGVSGGAAGALSIRGVGGAPTTGVALLIDGEPQLMGTMGHPIADICNSSKALGVEITRGPASVKYGSGAMGGVINIITEREQRSGFSLNLNSGFGSYRTLQSALSTNYSHQLFSVSATASYDSSKGHRENMEFEQYAGSVALRAKLSSAWSLRLSTSLNHFNSSNPGTIYSPLNENDSRITRAHSTLSIKNRGDLCQGHISLHCNFGKHRINDGYKATESPKEQLFLSKDYTYKLSLGEEFRLFKGNILSCGFDYSHIGGESENLYPATSESIPVSKQSYDEIAAHITTQQQLFKRISIFAGIRFERHSKVGAQWVPELSLSFKISQRSELSARFAKGFRFPTIREMYMFSSQNPELKPESLLSYELSYRQSALKQRLNFTINLFYIDGKNIIQTEIVESRPQNRNIARIKNHGIEGELNARLTRHLLLKFNYSYLNMEYPTLASPKHKLYGEFLISGRRIELSSGLQHISGLYTRLQSDNASALSESYTLWNLRLNLNLWKWCSIWARAENLLDKEYQINYGYPMPGVTIMAGFTLKI